MRIPITWEATDQCLLLVAVRSCAKRWIWGSLRVPEEHDGRAGSNESYMSGIAAHGMKMDEKVPDRRRKYLRCDRAAL